MTDFAEKYINPFTDYGFKKLFGEEPNKDLLLGFLNELLKEEQGQITDLTYLKTEQLGASDIDRKAIFDFVFDTDKNEPDKFRYAHSLSESLLPVPIIPSRYGS